MNQPQAARKAERHQRLLIVDDNLDHVRSLAMMFDIMGYHVDYAINATAAVDMAATHKPDVIFLDLLLPDGHGSAVCAEIRKLPGLAGTRIFGVTASSRMIDLQRALDAG